MTSKADLYFNTFFDVSKSIYILYNPLTNLTKIGITSDVDRRVRQIETQSGCELELLEWSYLGKCQALSDKEIEKMLHQKYSKHRKIGEWFNLAEEMIGDAINDMIALSEFGEFDC